MQSFVGAIARRKDAFLPASSDLHRRSEGLSGLIRSLVQSSDPPLKLDRAQQNIMLVDRGPTNSYTNACKFTEKVWHAQNAGAVAVLVVNYDDTQTTMVSCFFSFLLS